MNPNYRNISAAPKINASYISKFQSLGSRYATWKSKYATWKSPVAPRARDGSSLCVPDKWGMRFLKPKKYQEADINDRLIEVQSI